MNRYEINNTIVTGLMFIVLFTEYRQLQCVRHRTDAKKTENRHGSNQGTKLLLMC